MLAPASPADIPWPPRKTFWSTLVVAGVSGAAALVYLFRDVLLLLFVAILISTAVKPLIRRLKEAGLSVATAAFLVYGALVFALVGVAVAGLPMLAAQAAEMLKGLPEAYERFHRDLSEISHPLVARLVSELPDELPETLDLDSEETAGAIKTISQGIGYSAAALRGLLAALATLLLAFYWSLHEERAIRACLLSVPPAQRESAAELVGEIQCKLGAFLRGQSLLCLIMAVMALIVYGLIGLPYVFALAAVAGCLEAMPVFGPILGAIPALVVALSVSPVKAAWTLAAIIVMQQIEGNVLVPRIMDRSVGVNSIVTLLAIMALSSLGGLAGAVLAIPLAAVVQLLFQRWLLNPAALEPAPPVGRDAVSRLRYQAQQLAHDLQLQIRDKETSSSTRHDDLEEKLEALARDVDRCLASADPAPVVAGSVIDAGKTP